MPSAHPAGLASVAISLAALFAGCIASGPEQVETASIPELPAPAVSSFSKLICEPVCNIQLSSLAGPANEVAIAMDPNDPLRLLGGAKDYNDRYTDCVTISWYNSEDGGRTWEEGYFREPRTLPAPHPPIGDVSYQPAFCSRIDSDPVPVFDGAGNALMTTLTSDESGTGIFVLRRAPGSGEWERVANAFDGATDKQWADVDPGTGDVYVVTADFRAEAEHAEELVVSRDGGGSWEHVAWLDGVFGTQIAIAPGGHIVLAGIDNGFDAQVARLVVLHSADRGSSWSTVIDEPMGLGFGTRYAGLIDARGQEPGDTKLYRTPPLPAAAAAKASSRVAVAYFDDAGAGDWDVFARISDDGGATWGAAVRVVDDASGADQFLPAVAVGPSGDVHVTFYDARNDPSGEGALLDLTYAHSADGKAFGKNLRISEESFAPHLSRHQAQPFNIGDYLGVVASDAEAVMLWADTRNDRSEIFAAIVGG